ncbi:hypothetical protein ACKC9G_05285 [Pokkaliibacter sp. CJK22405]|uniref:hypothetical protein n=1 Tax=Pokkaliibacter sp. CJK22405 TaxID=3384615 RepID=UPI003984BEDD
MTTRADAGIYAYHIQLAEETFLNARFRDARLHSFIAYEAAVTLFDLLPCHCTPEEVPAALLRATKAVSRSCKIIEDWQTEQDYCLNSHDLLMAASINFSQSESFRRACYEALPQSLDQVEDALDQPTDLSVLIAVREQTALTLRYFAPEARQQESKQERQSQLRRWK